MTQDALPKKWKPGQPCRKTTVFPQKPFLGTTRTVAFLRGNSEGKLFNLFLRGATVPTEMPPGGRSGSNLTFTAI